MILKNPVNYGGRLFEPGENVRGKLPLDLIEVLQENGQLDPVDPAETEDSPASEKELSLSELEAFLAQVQDPAEAKKLLEKEQSTKSPRTGAIKQLEKRLKELQDVNI